MPQPGRGFGLANYGGRDVSRLGSWNQLGFLERTQQPTVPLWVYIQTGLNAGAMPGYPTTWHGAASSLAWASIMLWAATTLRPMAAAMWEIHQQVSAAFFDTYRLPAGDAVSWREVWYPVSGMGDMAFANEVAAIHPYATGEGLAVGFFPAQPSERQLSGHGQRNGSRTADVGISPAQPFNGVVATAAHLHQRHRQITFVGGGGQVVYSYTYSGQFK